MTVRSLDLRGTPCPLNFVKTKLVLEQMTAGELLEVVLDAGEPCENVPRSVQEEGHLIVEREVAKGVGRFLIEKKG